MRPKRIIFPLPTLRKDFCLKKRIEELENYDSRDEPDNEELEVLIALADEAEGYADWQHGTTLIRATYFVEYAEQLAEDIGAIERDASWPNSYIDWDAAADALLIDYTEVDFDGAAYYIR